jgi:hypothetical protein
MSRSFPAGYIAVTSMLNDEHPLRVLLISSVSSPLSLIKRPLSKAELLPTIDVNFY